jgi:ATP-dependent helicase/nuclease subunit B
MSGGPGRKRRVLLLGAAGSGKTRALMRRVWSRIRRGREERVLLVLPTYGQVEHVRRLLLLRVADRAGFFESPVVTFSSLAERVVDHPLRRMLSAAEKDLLLREVLRAAPPAFRGVARYPGFRALALEVLKEIKENGVAAPDAAEVLLATSGSLDADGRDRLRALAAVLLTYQERLDAAGLVDHEDLLVRLRDRLREDAGLLADLDAFAVDGFTDFTRVEREILGLLAARAGRTWVSLTTGTGPGRDDLFRASRETREWLTEHDFRIRRLRSTPRFRRPALRALEENLFRPRAAEAPLDDGLDILVGVDIEDEVDRIARRVGRLIREEGRRPHEIGLLVRNRETYGDLLERAFAAHGLPLLLHAARPLAREGAMRGVLALLATLGRGWRGEDVRDLLLADTLAPGDARPDEVDAWLRSREEARLPDGRVAWLRATSERPALDEALAAVAAEEEALRAAATPADRAARLREWWGGLLRAADPESEGAPAEARAFRAFDEALGGVVRALDAAAVGPVDLEGFLVAVREAVERTDVRPRSRRFETVHALSVEEARQWELPVVFVVGLLEGVFPRRPREDVLLRDRERRDLNRGGRLLLRERLRVADEERYLFYVAATRARDRLVLTRPATDRDGGPLLPSFFLADVRRVFSAGDLDAATTVGTRSGTVAVPPARGKDLYRRALAGLADPWVPESETGREVARAAALHDRLVLADATYRRHLAAGLERREPPGAAIRDPALLEEVARRRASFSATALQRFASCPYLDFAERTLGLRERPTDEVRPLDLGNLVHEALRAVFAEGADPREAFDAAAGEALGARRPDLGTLRDLEELRTKVVDIANDERARLARHGLRAEAVERSFGAGDGVTLGGVPLRGQLDRVDVSPDGDAMVVDYKLAVSDSSRKLLRDIREGISFQMPVYLAAVREAMAATPKGAVLFPVRKGRGARGLVRSDAAEGLAPAGRLEVLDEGELEALLEETGAAIANIARRVHAGDIAVEPRTTDRCHRGACPFVDLCRVEPWRIEAARAEEAS